MTGIPCKVCGCKIGPEGYHFTPAICVKALRKVVELHARGMNDAAISYAQNIVDAEARFKHVKEVAWLALHRLPGFQMIVTPTELEGVSQKAEVDFKMSDDKKTVVIRAVMAGKDKTSKAGVA